MSEKRDQKNSHEDQQQADKKTSSSAGNPADRFLNRLTALPFIPLAPDEPLKKEPRKRRVRGRKVDKS